MLDKNLKGIITVILFAGIILYSCNNHPEKVDWPEVTSQAKPWSRWWWQGSSVTKEGITAELEAYEKAGIGGLELTPIYGVIGDEKNFLSYLSPEWMEMLEYTLTESQRLGLGVDMANGTGWPFGGPWVGADDACKYLAHRTYALQGGQRLDDRILYQETPMIRAVNNQVYQTQMSIYDVQAISGRKVLRIEDLVVPIEKNTDLQGKALDQVRFEELLPLQSLMGFGPGDVVVNLTGKVGIDGILDWTAPEGQWKLIAIFQGWHGKMVERAAPGGEGNVIDHFSEQAIHHYLSRFDTAFAGRDIGTLRAFFNDSYEVDDARGQANWTPRFFEEFIKRRGYDLREHLPALFGEDIENKNIRVLSDFRETFSDLILETFTSHWSAWAKEHGKIIRNQSHGAPANILDLYAVSDIPETEGTEILRIKFATSAAHVAGHPLASAEAATWLNEHFISNLSDIKQNLDRYLIGGVNHLFYHGTCYSPPDDAWPGRLFYAAIHANPRNPLWYDWEGLNQYIARTQSFLQAGRPDHDILLYFPMYDRFATQGPELLEHFDGYGPTFEGTQLEKVAMYLHDEGYTFDFISDRQILNLKNVGGKLQTGGNHYQTILVPYCRFMPLSVFTKLEELAEQGISVVFEKDLPGGVPGLNNWEERQKNYDDLVDQLSFEMVGDVGRANLDKGHFLKGDDLDQLLQFVAIRKEPLVKQGLEFARRKINEDFVYFISNWSGNHFDGWIALSKEVKSIAIFDPMTSGKGVAKTREGKNGVTELYLQLDHGEAYLVQTLNGPVQLPAWPYYRHTDPNISLSGDWSLQFLEGGPELPDSLTLTNLQSWTQLGKDCETFSGRARYRTIFSRPETETEHWLLDLGVVHESARVKLNGEDLGHLIGPNYQLVIDQSQILANNILEIEVSNLMANRIIDMDRNNQYWKRFYNVNFPSKLPENRGKNGLFDASNWEPVTSGLLGPVTLSGLKILDP